VRTIDFEFQALQFKLPNNTLSPKHNIDARVFIPKVAHENPNKPLDLLIWFHGGGFVLGSHNDYTSDSAGKMLSDTLQKYVLYINYRLAPEYEFPFGLEDCYSSVYWAAHLTEHDNCLFYTADSNQINCKEYAPVDLSHVYIGGDSAGGNFAVLTVLLWNKRGTSDLGDHELALEDMPYFHDHGFHSVSEEHFNIDALLLVYPSLFPYPRTDSMARFEDTYFISKPVRTFFRYAYIGNDDDEDLDDEEDDTSIRKRALLHPYVSPFRAKGLDTLPRTLILLAENDALIDEGKHFHKVLRENNVYSEVHVLPNTCHGFFTFTFLEQSAQATQMIQEFLNKVS
jgi:acetyl esterase